MKNKSLINKETVSVKIIIFILKAIFHVIEDEKVHNCNHTEYRLQPCITAYALFNIQY